MLTTTASHLVQLHQELTDGTAQLFDVREPNEWEAGHLTLAHLVPLSELKAGAAVDHDKAKKTYIHCRSGKRVMTARPLLEAMGFSDVTDLREGFDALAQAGFERAQ